MKSKVLVSSILTIALCLSLIAGSTFALFTDQTQFGIEVTSGDVEIYASAGISAVYSAKGPVAEHDDPFLKDENGNYYEHEKQTNYVEKDGKIVTGYFANDGDATITGANLALNKVTPGDRVDVQINVDNRSDVAIAYRYKITAADTNLAKGMVVTIDDVPYTGLNSWTSAWFYADTTKQEGNDIATKVISIELPVYAGNEYQSEHAGNQYYEKDAEGNLEAKTYEKDVIQSVNYTILVEAVQGNAVTDNSSKVDLMVYDADTLAKVLKSNFNSMSVKLGSDIDVPVSALSDQTPGSGEYKLGGDNTEAINIDLNGYKLNLTTNYWSAIGAKNDNATITIKNGSMTSTGNSSTTWNAYNVRFCNCNYVIENVSFDKPVALDNAGKSTTMKNVTIDEDENFYALWITAEGQNVAIDGLTINSGRGIKIDEQYVGAPAKVTLNVSNAKFDTSEKAAIMVKSAAGADIALNNVDIANTPDTVRAVWVDEDSKAYVDLVTVTGGEMCYEGDVATDASSLAAAIASGNSTIAISNGNYKFPSGIKSGMTLVCSAGTVFEGNSKLNIGGATVIGATFSNATGTAVDQTINGTFKDCTFTGKNGLRWCYAGETVVFENCVFDGSVYGVHFDGGANEVIFRDCTFSGFNALGGAITKVTMEGCTFKANGRSGYNGINLWGSTEMIDCTFIFDGSVDYEWVDACGDNKEYTFTNCVVTDGENEKDFASVVGNYGMGNKITINNKELVIASDEAVLNDAIANGKTEIQLGSGNYTIPSSAKNKELTLVGNGNTVIDIVKAGGEGADGAFDTSKVVFENLTISTDSKNYTGWARLNATYNNCTINGTYTLYGNSEFNNCTFNVSGDVYNIWTWGATEATFNNCTFNSDGKAMLLYGTVNTKLTMNDCTFNDKGGLTDLKAAIEIGNDYNKSYELIVNNATVNGYEINDKGTNTGTTLWANKNSMGTDKLNVVVDGVDVH